MFNRSGIAALAIVAAIVAWGAFYKDGTEPPATSAHTSKRQAKVAPHASTATTGSSAPASPLAFARAGDGDAGASPRPHAGPTVH